uniref:(northern house mosquito) hypothetical protein n=1 Tax=Culex pipiens TaxID=7175 RepID=A0A8D8MIB5_CULPI
MREVQLRFRRFFEKSNFPRLHGMFSTKVTDQISHDEGGLLNVLARRPRSYSTMNSFLVSYDTLLGELGEGKRVFSPFWLFLERARSRNLHRSALLNNHRLQHYVLDTWIWRGYGIRF